MILSKTASWIKGLSGYALDTLLPTLLVFVAGVLVIRIITKLMIKLLEKSKLEKAAHSLIRTAIRTVLYILLVLPWPAC